MSMRDEYTGSKWWRHSGIWAHLLSQNSSICSCSLFSWLSPSHLLWNLKLVSSLIRDYQLHFHLSYAFYTFDVWKRLTNTWCTYIYSDLPDKTCSLHLSTCLKHSSLAAFSDHFPPEIRQEIYQSSDTESSHQLLNDWQFLLSPLGQTIWLGLLEMEVLITV